MAHQRFLEPHCWHDYTKREPANRVHGPFNWTPDGKSGDDTRKYVLEQRDIVTLHNNCCICNKDRIVGSYYLDHNQPSPPPPPSRSHDPAGH